MSVYGGPDIVTDGLILHIDPANSKCYPGSGTNINDLKNSVDWHTFATFGSNVTYDYLTKSFDFPNDTEGKGLVTDNSYVFTSDTSSLTFDHWCLLTGSIALPSLFYDVGQGANPFVWIYENVGYLYIQSSNGTNYNAYTLAQMTKNVWMNIITTFKYGAPGEARVKSYVNGVQWQDHSPAFICNFPSGNTYKTIGDYGNAASHNWAGKIGPVKVYNRILSKTEAVQNFNSLKSRYLT